MVRREKACVFSGCNSHPATIAPAGSNRNGGGGNEAVEAFDGKGRLGRPREQAGRNMRERRAGLETLNVGADPTMGRGRPQLLRGKKLSEAPQQSHRGIGGGMSAQGNTTQHGKPQRWDRVNPNRNPARDQPGPYGVAERSVVPLKPGNAGGGKGPQFKVNVRSSDGPGNWR